MTNPVKSNTRANLPPNSIPVVDSNGNLTTLWRNNYFLPLLNRTGNTEGLDLGQVESTASSALNLSNQNAAEIATLDVEVSTAQTDANKATAAAASAQSAGDTANQTANALVSIILSRFNNLSDVTSVSASRANLGLNSYPLTFTYDTLSSGLTRYIPVTQGLIVPVGLVGSQSYCGTVPAANAPFSLRYIRGGITSTIGTITLISASQSFTLTCPVAVTLMAGDVLSLVAPGPADSTLANVGISLSLTLNT